MVFIFLAYFTLYNGLQFLSQHQGFFPMSLFFTSGGQRIGASASASDVPTNIQD